MFTKILRLNVIPAMFVLSVGPAVAADHNPLQVASSHLHEHAATEVPAKDVDCSKPQEVAMMAGGGAMGAMGAGGTGTMGTMGTGGGGTMGTMGGGGGAGTMGTMGGGGGGGTMGTMGTGGGAGTMGTMGGMGGGTMGGMGGGVSVDPAILPSEADQANAAKSAENPCSKAKDKS